jgi:hypothetical protein
MLVVAVPAPLRPTLLAVHSCTREHANLLVPGQIVCSLVTEHNLLLPSCVFLLHLLPPMKKGD